MKKYAKYMALAVTLALLGLIFYFSAQPGAVSYKVSETVMNTVQSVSYTHLTLPTIYSV